VATVLFEMGHYSDKIVSPSHYLTIEESNQIEPDGYSAHLDQISIFSVAGVDHRGNSPDRPLLLGNLFAVGGCALLFSLCAEGFDSLSHHSKSLRDER
jgi:hypothetical protein